MTFDPYSLTQDRIHRLRSAAEAAWGDDTRHESLHGHPDLSAGQSYVTARWLKHLLGGGQVAQKGGYHFWLSPEGDYALDLVGERHSRPAEDWSTHHGIKLDEEDQGWDPTHLHQHRPGPPVYKRASHPLFKDAKISDQNLAPTEFRLFSDRVHKAYEA